MVIDAKSGVSGAGRAAEEEMAVVKETDDTKPYKVTGHRHTPGDRPGARRAGRGERRRDPVRPA